jgi:hypothetical protein
MAGMLINDLIDLSQFCVKDRQVVPHTHGTVDLEEENFDYEWRWTWDIVALSLLRRYSPRRTEKIYKRLPDVIVSCSGILCTESRCYILLRR